MVIGRGLEGQDPCRGYNSSSGLKYLQLSLEYTDQTQLAIRSVFIQKIFLKNVADS